MPGCCNWPPIWASSTKRLPGVRLVLVVLAQHLDGQVAAQVAVAAPEDDADAAAADLLQQVIAGRAGSRRGDGFSPEVRRPVAGPGRVPGVGPVRPHGRADGGLGHLAADVLDQGRVAGEARVVIAGARVVPGAAAVVPVQQQELAEQGRPHGPGGRAQVLFRVAAAAPPSTPPRSGRRSGRSAAPRPGRGGAGGRCRSWRRLLGSR